MYTEAFEQMFKLNKNMINPFNEWAGLVTDVYRRAAQQNLELISENLARTADQLKRLSLAKKPEEFVSIQKDCFNETIAMSVETMQKLLRHTMANVEELSKVQCRDPFTTTKSERSSSERSQRKTAESTERHNTTL